MKKPDPIPLHVLNDDSIPKKRHQEKVPPGQHIGCNFIERKHELKARETLKKFTDELKKSTRMK